MRTEEAIERLEEFGWSVHSDGGGWKVFDNDSFNGRYNDRELIALAKSKKTPNWKSRNKVKVGPGGIFCPCCTKANKEKMKKWDRKRTRTFNDYDDEI
jgi:hypothetical protein